MLEDMMLTNSNCLVLGDFNSEMWEHEVEEWEIDDLRLMKVPDKEVHDLNSKLVQ
uniref:Endonuclease/exonuclease/phosphatase domain-containing protein n=1 Tax=Arion vulgaris TaxID=1028688 RepID=A0A0B7A0A6_9EUPU